MLVNLKYIEPAFNSVPAGKQSLHVGAGDDGHKTLGPSMAVGSLYIKEFLL